MVSHGRKGGPFIRRAWEDALRRYAAKPDTVGASHNGWESIPIPSTLLCKGLVAPPGKEGGMTYFPASPSSLLFFRRN